VSKEEKDEVLRMGKAGDGTKKAMAESLSLIAAIANGSIGGQ
jgi:hypothetical protein